MTAIFKREMESYFNSITGYIFLSVIYLFGGIFLWVTSLYMGNGDISGVFASLLIIVLLLIPILTMRLISEELKQKTDQALFTAPIHMSSIVFGKYLSALVMYIIGISITWVYALVFSIYTKPDWASITGNFVGLLLVGAALISIGLFVSSTTESQIVAAVASYVLCILIMLIDGIAEFFSNSFLYDVLKSLSFSQHYKNFTLGIINATDTIFFLSVCAIFIILTIRSLDKKKWN